MTRIRGKSTVDFVIATSYLPFSFLFALFALFVLFVLFVVFVVFVVFFLPREWLQNFGHLGELPWKNIFRYKTWRGSARSAANHFLQGICGDLRSC